MTEYTVKNTSSAGKSFVADNGMRVHFGPGEQKTLDSLPPEQTGWEIEEKGSQNQDDNSGGEN